MPSKRRAVERKPRSPAARDHRALVALAIFALVFIGESVFSYTQKSATWDEPIHLVDGYYSLFRRDHRYDPQHPPLARVLPAVALTGASIAVDASAIERTTPDRWAVLGVYDDAFRFLYKANDADRLLYRARFVMVLLGVALGIIVFLWAREWLGFIPASAALAMVALEPNLVAHFSLVTTDAPLVLFWCGATYATWRLTRAPSLRNLAVLCAFMAAAALTKFTAALLFPILVVLLTISVVVFRRISWRFAVATMTAVIVTTWLAIWAAYDFRYLPSAQPNWSYRFHDNPIAIEREPTLSTLVGWIDGNHLLPNVFSQGFLLGQTRSAVRNSFLAGRYSITGWWYYFPVAIAIKTPLPLLALAAAGIVVALRRRAHREMLVFLIVPGGAMLAIAMLSHINIGVRHVLVIQPLLILLAALTLSILLESKRRAARVVMAAAVSLWLLEYAVAYPHPLAFFNSIVRGPRHGIDYLSDSNLDWGQDLKSLKAWMQRNRVEEIALDYFGLADPAYYGIRGTYLDGGTTFAPPSLVRAPRLPGYVAVSATILQGTYASSADRDFYQPLLAQTPVASLGHSINVYWVEQPWWTIPRPIWTR